MRDPPPQRGRGLAAHRRSGERDGRRRRWAGARHRRAGSAQPARRAVGGRHRNGGPAAPRSRRRWLIGRAHRRIEHVSTRLPPSAVTRLTGAAAAGVAIGAVVYGLADTPLAILAGIATAEAVFVVAGWIVLWP